MNIKRKSGAAILAAAMVLCCGCGNSNNTTNKNKSNSDKTQSTASGVAFTVPQSTSQPNTSNEITYFGSQDISAAAELFEKNTGCTVKTEKSGSNYVDALSEKISADNSPDLCDKVDNSFPYLISLNYYEDLTNYIDTTSPQWTGLTDVIDGYSFKGGRYFYPTTIKVMPQFLIYIKTTYVQCQSPDPEKLWLKDEWTWDTFKRGANDVIGSITNSAGDLICGDNIFDNFLATTGEQIFPRKGNVFSNGLSSNKAERVSELLSERKIINSSISDANSEIQNVVFISGDEKTLAKLRQTDLAVGIVPFPRDDNSDKYYCKAVSEGFLVPKGAKNIKNAASFINCSRIVSVSEEQREKDEKTLIDSGLLRSDAEWLETLRSSDKMTPILIDSNCFDDKANAAVRKMLSFTDNGTWEDVSKECSSEIDRAVENINKVNE